MGDGKAGGRKQLCYKIFHYTLTFNTNWLNILIVCAQDIGLGVLGDHSKSL
jgi:hypothetical protein